MSQVELLCEAASVMRERAEKATPGPWEADQSEIYGNPRISWVGETLRLENASQTVADAEHIASWHPAVAHAVAEWLEDEAARIDDVPYRVDSDWVERNFRQPLAVARAYLGVQP